MSRLDHAAMAREPGPECVCGAELKQVPLPADIAALAGVPAIWVHAESGDTRCYPDQDDLCLAEPLEDYQVRVAPPLVTTACGFRKIVRYEGVRYEGVLRQRGAVVWAAGCTHRRQRDARNDAWDYLKTLDPRIGPDGYRAPQMRPL
jgi:hypothetical protein